MIENSIAHQIDVDFASLTLFVHPFCFWVALSLSHIWPRPPRSSALFYFWPWKNFLTRWKHRSNRSEYRSDRSAYWSDRPENWLDQLASRWSFLFCIAHELNLIVVQLYCLKYTHHWDNLVNRTSWYFFNGRLFFILYQIWIFIQSSIFFSQYTCLITLCLFFYIDRSFLSKRSLLVGDGLLIAGSL